MKQAVWGSETRYISESFGAPRSSRAGLRVDAPAAVQAGSGTALGCTTVPRAISLLLLINSK